MQGKTVHELLDELEKAIRANREQVQHLNHELQGILAEAGQDALACARRHRFQCINGGKA